MNRERRIRNERRADIAALVAGLDDAANYRIGFEVLRAARLVPGWALKRGTPGLFEIDCPGRPGLHLNRDDTLALLRSRWLPAACAEIGATEPDVTDGITEAAKMEEPVTPSSALAATTTATDELADLVKRARLDLAVNGYEAIDRSVATLRAIENGLRGVAG